MSHEMDEYNRDRYQLVVNTLMEKDFDKLYDHDFQVVFGKFPPKCVFRAQFPPGRLGDVKFRVWKQALVKQYYFWVRSTNYPNSDKLTISPGIYAALDEYPDPSWFNKRKPPKRRGKAKNS
jgi:hypothetical protein